MKSHLFRIIVFFMIAAFLNGCGMDVVTIEVSEQGQAGGLSLQFPGMSNFGGSLSKALSEKDVNPSDVDSMKTQNVTLSLLSQGGLTNDLSFLDEMKFSLTADGMQPVDLATKSDFASGDRQVEFDVVPDLEMKPYLDAGGVRIDLDAAVASPAPDIVDLEVVFKLRVDVNVI